MTMSILKLFLTAGEVRENISLKTGAKKTSWFSCKDECLGGSRLVILSFTGLTIAITISLIIQIYYGDYQVCFNTFRCEYS